MCIMASRRGVLSKTEKQRASLCKRFFDVITKFLDKAGLKIYKEHSQVWT